MESHSQVITMDSNRMPWQELPIPELDASIFMKPLFLDNMTGMSISKACYKAGFMNKSHTHHCAHGMYVLDGILVTSVGEFAPGSFVWFPEGETMFHGAQEDNDVTFLFITDKNFDIQYNDLE
ncbi:cupin domain-containing protein [Acinetobacter sp. TY1]|uniref:cupin domain-containing protein n=1 Tax=unclassified Acinetobacter TaxID=196816 RepID=UPI00302B6C89